MATLERACPCCEYRTTRFVAECPICNVTLVTQERTWGERRRGVRVPVPPGVEAVLGCEVTVAVRDLNFLGACLEHADPLLPGQQCFVMIPPRGANPLELPARVVWSRAYPLDPGPGGTGWVYRSGVEFREVPPEALRGLRAYLDGLAGAGQAPVSGSVALREP